MLILMLGGVDDKLPDFSHMFMGDRAWKSLDEHLGQDEGYSASIYITTSLPLRNVRELFINN